MKMTSAYSVPVPSGCMPAFHIRYLTLLTAIFLFIAPLEISSQDLPEYDEISVFLEIPRVGGSEIDAAIRGEEVYLPVTDLFNLLKIKYIPAPGLESVTGFFIDPEAVYEISRTRNHIIYQGKTYNLDPGDLIRTEFNLYLRSSYFGSVFGLECVFDFRSLSVRVNSRLELPLIREMRLEEMRRNLSRLKGEAMADSSVARTYPLFKFGMADWSAIASQEINGKSDTRLNLSLGAMIAGGEATASLYYNSTDPFTEKQQYYLWRYVNNDFAPLRQVMAGKIATHSVSSIFNPVVGVQFTNTPTTYRRSFGTYTLSDRTEPGWIVELYVNNVLVDYVKADASGFFTFEVPLVYGNSMVMLKFYGPWGEERSREQNINIPFNFLPEKTFEYRVSGGFVEDSLKSRFSRASLNYGVTRSLTMGGGVEYLSSLTSQPLMPYVTASLRITNNLLLSGEYVHGVRTNGTLSYRMPSNLQLDLKYTLYDKDQKAIFYNYREERKATLSLPLKIGKFSSYQRLTLYQIILPASKYTTGEWMFSGSLFGINTNLTTYALLLNNVKPYVYSNLSLALRLPAGFILMPQAQYGYTHNQLLSAKMRVEKRLLSHAYLNLSYEQNFRNDLRMAELGLRYDFSFAQTGISVRQSNNRTSFIEYARGSLINDRETKYLGTDNRPNVGRGGITVTAFIDINANGKKDRGEPKAYGLNLRVSGGRIEKNERDTTIRILGLEPYTNCFIELDPNSFDNISWRIPLRTLSVAVDPNILKSVEIPVTVAGEASGTVSLIKDDMTKGLGRVIIGFYTAGGKVAGKTLTEIDGYYSFLGLAPGEYTVHPDTSQMRKLGMISDPELIHFSITAGIDGDIVDGLDFTVRMIDADTTITPPVITEKPAVITDTTYLILHELTEEVYTITEDSWAIQIGAFRSRSLAEGFRRNLETDLGKKVEITIAGDYYRVRILDLPTREEVDENVIKLNKLGFKELWIIRLLAREQQRLLITREDSLARITESLIEREDSVFTAETAYIQLGAFRRKSNAIALSDRLSVPPDEKIIIVYEDGYYKVRVSLKPILDQTVLEAMEKLMPSFGKLGLKDIWILPVTTQPIEEPVEREPEALRKIGVQPSKSIRITEEKAGGLISTDRFVPLEPGIALQVAVYHKRAEAFRARRRITNKLGLPVEIVQQWDYYHVIVTGFFTREETIKYFPELAGLGFPGITLIENYKSRK